MQRLDGGSAVPQRFRGGVVALGNFDGFHAGHQSVVGRAVMRARQEGRPVLVATFDPHPVRYFKPDASPFRLTTLDQREALFAKAGADAMIVFRFDSELAKLSAAEFVAQCLADTVGAAGIVTGQDFTFGAGRSGNVKVLAGLGAAHGIWTEAVGPVTDSGEIVSSSRIREALQDGDCVTAARLLTRPFSIEGIVQHGAKLGRTIGFPTANMVLGNYLRPRFGIYAIKGRLADGRVFDGAANLGIRPTFDPPIELLEPYFFDFSGDLYGQTIEVEFHHFIRPEAKFDGVPALMAQIARDCDEARRLLAQPISA